MGSEVFSPKMVFRIFIVLFCTACFATASDRFIYSVFDVIKTGKVHYEQAHHIVFYEVNPSKLIFNTEYRVQGCNQDSFTYTVESWERNISRERLLKLIAAIRKIPLQKLQYKKQFHDGADWFRGYIDIDGTTPFISGRSNQPEYIKIRALITEFLDEVAPKAIRKTTFRTIEGDFVPAHAVTFETLLKTPWEYDGKRVRLTGYYHCEFEDSNFGPDKNADYTKSVWLGEPSTFAKPENVKQLNDTFISAEGTFNAEPGGNGLWPGTLERVTLITKAKPIE